MTRVTVHVAKTTLSKLIERVEAGEEVIIARGNKPVARLVAVEPSVRRSPGGLKGLVTAGEDAFAPLPESELEAWEGV
ncbi:MAG: type II toxin-antitoxin system Phd/YefM family antitoxin [Solirubrobacterales bacterium]|nr:type II toxin-antitoxin system Phd/YefM family antitoxin [Solirubrobacterales bacterium]